MRITGPALAGAALVGVLVASPAAAATGLSAGSAGRGAAGQRLQVSPVHGLDPDGQEVSVTGTGYDTAKGIYLAFCVAPAAGAVPSPCGGGADTSGSSGSSVWISSNPPSYGKDLATPYGPGGSFHTILHVAAALNPDVDCRHTACAVVTRADHTRSDDRSQDVIVPVSFVAADPGPSSVAWAGIGAGGAAVVVAATGAGWLVLRRRRTPAGGSDG